MTAGGVLGVDGGGTKTLAVVVAADATILSRDRLASLDPTAGDGWREEIARLAAGPGGPRIEAAVFGLPFHGEIDRFSSAQRATVRRHFPEGATVENDVRIAFDGAFACGPGALSLSGTGSMAWASLAGPDSPHVRVGGWGDVFGDEGSAYWIGREALTLLSRHVDGRAPAPGFAGRLLAAMAIGPDELSAWCYGLANRRAGVAGLARHVAAIAADGEAAAQRLMDRAADELCEQLAAAWRLCGGTAPLRWSYAGGVFNAPEMADRMAARLGVRPTQPRLPPVGGAVLRAARQAGWPIDDAWIGRLAAALRTAFAP
ncbi:N-acetylglucosamine kinase [Azospirillum sp. ST 5-10]|uniref:N-acetylglucosamine kinase n=1 Tax=unclassified Azospirillum TaxID=2630922 RepID=UPI003F4A6E05